MNRHRSDWSAMHDTKFTSWNVGDTIKDSNGHVYLVGHNPETDKYSLIVLKTGIVFSECSCLYNLMEYRKYK